MNFLDLVVAVLALADALDAGEDALEVLDHLGALLAELGGTGDGALVEDGLDMMASIKRLSCFWLGILPALKAPTIWAMRASVWREGPSGVPAHRGCPVDAVLARGSLGIARGLPAVLLDALTSLAGVEWAKGALARMTCLRFESDEGDRWGKRAASDVTWKVLDWDGKKRGTKRCGSRWWSGRAVAASVQLGQDGVRVEAGEKASERPIVDELRIEPNRRRCFLRILSPPSGSREGGITPCLTGRRARSTQPVGAIRTRRAQCGDDGLALGHACMALAHTGMLA